ncbi:polyhomeotic-like protein 1 [Narcine bancroftii]|uniref:polyhomeotic-like protein 1 n=1 Tax=Narcine bancroftii TaxID=1343680 RepID=UPI0038315C44
MDPHTVGLAEAHVQSEPHSLPDAQGRPPPAKGQTMAGPTNPGSVVQAAASTQMPGSGLGLSAGSPVSAGDPHLPLPLKSVVMGIKRKAEDVEEEGEGSNLGPPDLIPSHGAGPEAKPAITGKASLHPGPPVLTSVSTLLVGRHGGEKPPRAIVKPHILTHVIEGFVIQEGAEPFPVEATCDQANCKQKAEDPPVLQPETPLSSQHPPSEPVQQGGE